MLYNNNKLVHSILPKITQLQQHTGIENSEESWFTLSAIITKAVANGIYLWEELLIVV